MSYNDWINATAQGSEAGEIVVTFSSQLMRGLENEKNAIDKRIVSLQALCSLSCSIFQTVIVTFPYFFQMASYALLKKLIPREDGTKQLGEVVVWKPEPKQSSKGKGKKANKGAKSKGRAASQVLDEEQQDGNAASLRTSEAVLVKRNPKYYSDVEEGYGICVYDTVKVI